MNWRKRLKETEMPTEMLYRKVGRRYAPFGTIHDAYERDFLRAEGFQLRWTNTNGERCGYVVAPSTAAFEAAAMIAREAMIAAMVEASKSIPQGVENFTAKQRAVLSQCHALMEVAGVLLPSHWQRASLYDIADAGIEAVRI
jgi:hypothetical protein